MPGRHQLARARHRHGRRRPRPADRVAQVRRPRPAAHRPRRARRGPGQPRAHLPQVPRRPARVRRRRTQDARGADRAHRRAAQRARRARAADRRDRRGCEPAPAGTSSSNGESGAEGEDQPPAGGVPVDDLHALVTRTYSYAELSRELLENVLDMLDGRYPSKEFGELRARIVWDRLAGTIRARKGSRQLAIANAGTIPDRGLFAVTLPDGRRVGELDEEMVYEARPGQAFLLGASTWRIEEIGRDRVIVTPAPGAPGAVPFWKGDSVGRPKELGEAIGAFSRWAVEQDAETLQRDYDLDERAARNLLAYLREQQAATRVLPSERTIVLERFRDEIGDWRLCVLSPYGGRVHAAWGLALSARMRERFGLECDAIWSDDGIVLHLPDLDARETAGEAARAALRGRAGAARARRGRAGGRRRARRLGAVRRALPRERRPRAADPARLPGPAHAAVAAAAEGPEPARGRAPLRGLPDRARDLPRVPARRARRARPAGAAARPAHARDLARRGRDPDRLAVRLLAAVRLRRHLHVRGRHAQRRAPRGRALARPRPAARAARPGGAARADRPRRAAAASKTTCSTAPR